MRPVTIESLEYSDFRVVCDYFSHKREPRVGDKYHICEGDSVWKIIKVTEEGASRLKLSGYAEVKGQGDPVHCYNETSRCKSCFCMYCCWCGKAKETNEATNVYS